MKKNKIIALISIMISLAIVSSIVVFIVNRVIETDNYNKQDHVMNITSCRENKEQLSSSFPDFGDISEAYWDTGVCHKVAFFDIGPNVFWLNGYVVIDDKAVDELMDKYHWIRRESDVSGHFASIQRQIKNYDNFQWYESEDFNEYYGQFYGSFLLDPENNIVMFDLEEG